MMSVLCFIFGWLCFVMAFIDSRRTWPVRFEEKDESAQWVIAAALFFLVAK